MMCSHALAVLVVIDTYAAGVYVQVPAQYVCKVQSECVIMLDKY